MAVFLFQRHTGRLTYLHIYTFGQAANDIKTQWCPPEAGQPDAFPIVTVGSVDSDSDH